MDKESIENYYLCDGSDIVVSQLLSNPERDSEAILDSSCLFLFGPIGVGKTCFGHTLASRNGEYLYVQCSNFLTKSCDAVNTMNNIFEVAVGRKVATIFFDDVQLFNEVFSDISSNEEFIQRFVLHVNDCRLNCPNVRVILASYLPWNISNTLLAAFTCWVYIGLPSAVRRERVLKEVLAKHNHIVAEYAQLADMSRGFSTHEIVSAVTDAAWKPIRRLAYDSTFDPSEIDKLEPVPISVVDMEESIRNTSCCISVDDLKLFEQFMAKYRNEPLSTMHKLVEL